MKRTKYYSKKNTVLQQKEANVDSVDKRSQTRSAGTRSSRMKHRLKIDKEKTLKANSNFSHNVSDIMSLNDSDTLSLLAISKTMSLIVCFLMEGTFFEHFLCKILKFLQKTSEIKNFNFTKLFNILVQRSVAQRQRLIRC